MARWLIYGANGYTGGLIAQEAARRGLRPTLAGRNAEALAALAGGLGLEHRVFGLDDPVALARGIEGHTVILHCAGPFSRTARPMTDGCLKAGVHYLDITGEEGVLEALARRGDEARAAGVMLLPGACVDVVPYDCLAEHLPGRLPSPTRLSLALQETDRISRGPAHYLNKGLAR